MKKETKQEIKKDMDDVTKKTKRAIEFRAKELDLVTLKPTNEWVYGYLMRAANDGDYMIQEQSKRRHLVDGNTVGEYTGLVDKNGTKAFEGDILRLRDECIGLDVLVVIEFGKQNGEGTWGWILKPIKKLSGANLWLSLDILVWLNTPFAEVVGNIHDTPELLETSNDK